VGGQIVSMIVTNRPVGHLRQGYGGQDARAYTSATTVNSEMCPERRRAPANSSPAWTKIRAAPTAAFLYIGSGNPVSP
jgi:hypothetical protein